MRTNTVAASLPPVMSAESRGEWIARLDRLRAELLYQNDAEGARLAQVLALHLHHRGPHAPQ